MLLRSLLILMMTCALGVGTASRALAQFASPQALLDDIYKSRYRTKKSPRIDITKPAERQRYFETELAKAIANDQASDEVPEISGDLFIQSQSLWYSRLSVRIEETGDAKAKATVSFLREGDKSRTELVYEFVRGPKGWLIRDMRSSLDEANLRALVKAGP